MAERPPCLSDFKMLNKFFFSQLPTNLLSIEMEGRERPAVGALGSLSLTTVKGS